MAPTILYWTHFYILYRAKSPRSGLHLPMSIVDRAWLGVQWRRQNVIVLAARSGFRLVRKGFRSAQFSGRDRERKRRGAETEKIGGLLLVSSPPVPPLLFPSQRRGAFLQVQIPPIHWICWGVCPCSILPLPTELNLHQTYPTYGTVVSF